MSEKLFKRLAEIDENEAIGGNLSAKVGIATCARYGSHRIKESGRPIGTMMTKAEIMEVYGIDAEDSLIQVLKQAQKYGCFWEINSAGNFVLTDIKTAENGAIYKKYTRDFFLPLMINMKQHIKDPENFSLNELREVLSINKTVIWDYVAHLVKYGFIKKNPREVKGGKNISTYQILKYE